MGLYRSGPPQEFIEQIRKEYSIDLFIETGTYLAETSLWASRRFKTVFTIEAFKPLYDKAIAKYQDVENISFVFGNSKDKLSEIINKQSKPGIIWLDAHYCGNGTFGDVNKCPLVDEILVLNKSKFENVILIDDARVFLSPFTLSHNLEDWPTIVDIINLLNYIPDRYIIILEDVIICVPANMKHMTGIYAQKINSLNNLINTGGLSFFKKIIKFIIKKIMKI